jgi:hypothetical protein
VRASSSWRPRGSKRRRAGRRSSSLRTARPPCACSRRSPARERPTSRRAGRTGGVPFTGPCASGRSGSARRGTRHRATLLQSSSTRAELSARARIRRRASVSSSSSARSGGACSTWAAAPACLRSRLQGSGTTRSSVSMSTSRLSRQQEATRGGTTSTSMPVESTHSRPLSRGPISLLPTSPSAPSRSSAGGSTLCGS